MLFQHHLPPPPSTYTSDAVKAVKAEHGQGVDPNQLVNAYVHPVIKESNYIIGAKHGVCLPELNLGRLELITNSLMFPSTRTTCLRSWARG